jgi:hypothetical protein
MVDSPNQFNSAAFQAELSAASAALQDFAQGPARRASEDVGAAFERAGERIARAFGRAAISGETSFKRMAKIVLEELAKIALSQILGPNKPGGAPAQGQTGGPGVNVHFHMGAGADASSIARHQGQIAAQVARAVSYGSRNL